MKKQKTVHIYSVYIVKIITVIYLALNHLDFCPGNFKIITMIVFVLEIIERIIRSSNRNEYKEGNKIYEGNLYYLGIISSIFFWITYVLVIIKLIAIPVGILYAIVYFGVIYWILFYWLVKKINHILSWLISEIKGINIFNDYLNDL